MYFFTYIFCRYYVFNKYFIINKQTQRLIKKEKCAKTLHANYKSISFKVNENHA